MVAVVSAALLILGCPPPASTLVPEPTTEVFVPRPDGGRPVIPVVDAGPAEEEWVAGEPCPPESFGRVVFDDGGVEETPDGSIIFGLCASLRSISGQALLDARPAGGF